MKKIFSTIAVLIFMTGCVSLPDPGPEEQKYDIEIGKNLSKSSAPIKDILFIDTPHATSLYERREIIIRLKEGNKAPYFSHLQGVAWADRLPPLLEMKLVEALEGHVPYKNIVRASSRVPADHLLLTSIREFLVDKDDGNISVHVNIYAQLLDLKNNTIIKSKDFSVVERVPSYSFKEIHDGFNRALTNIMQDIIFWF
jgi:cholesterol transport system auxiliary component